MIEAAPAEIYSTDVNRNPCYYEFIDFEPNPMGLQFS